MILKDYEGYKERLRNLLLKMELSTAEDGMATLDAFVKDYEASLYNEIGRLTRQLHTSLATFQADEKFLNLTKDAIPSAKERLRYVVELTERAAQKVLTIVEKSIPISLEISEGASSLHRDWADTSTGNGRVEGATELPGNIREFLSGAKDNANLLHGHLTEILVAQEFQDITGQIIKKVIALVQDVEDNLIKLIKITGLKTSSQDEPIDHCAPSGPRVPGVDDQVVYTAGQDDVDQLLASLGF
jgi:chemotaxis protein CheZ